MIIPTKRSNTTNLFQHLKQRHKKLHDQCMSTKSIKTNKSTHQSQPEQTEQVSIVQAFASAVPYEKGSKRHKEITDAITYHICKDMMPAHIVSKDGFRRLIQTLDKRYQLPSRTHFTRFAIPEMYEKCKAGVEHELKQVKYFATTTDMWSSRTMEPYMSLTVHYVNDNFKMKSRCLQTAFFPEDHTGENISEGLKEALASWGLCEEQQVSITTDNGTNIVKAVPLNNWTRLQCFGHRLHLAIENAIKDEPRISRANGLCKKLVGHFSHSWKKKMMLAEAQEELQLPQHALITSCPTRWGSMQQMIERVLEQQRALSQVLSADRKTRHLVPQWQDTDVLESISKALHPLQEFTDALSSENYISVSYVKPVLHLLNTKILAVEDEDTDLTKTIKSKILNYINKHDEDETTQELLDTATFLDPRFKTSYTDEDKLPNIKARVMSDMEMSSHKDTSESVSNTCRENPDIDLPPPGKKARKSLGSFFKTTSAIAAELNSYLLSPSIDIVGIEDQRSAEFLVILDQLLRSA
ncbi:zinc finger BED domain-containing 1-like protein [Labeo rohita]|uniref:Zinc finger BED domain-containing 1-like protein n=1 Tax=Labeo rohita TaxID=84645 RepID=A0A498NLS2_LABRO|nr:zinc finger BED domain-containing 1-like protein [Labeo rohita]